MFVIRSSVVVRSVALVAALSAGFAAESAPALTVTAATAGKSDVGRYVTLTGTVRPFQETVLHSKITGYVTKLNVELGDVVSAGQVLAEIEAPELLVDRERTLAELELADLELKRLTAARQGAPDLVTPQSLDAAQGRADQAKAQLKRSDALLAYSKLSAPFAGVISRRWLDVGALVTAASTSGAVVTVTDLSRVRVQIPVPQAEATRIRVGLPVTMRSLDGSAAANLNGTITRQAWTLDEASKTLLAEVELANAAQSLRPGMFVASKIQLELHSQTLAVPTAAVVREKTRISGWKIVNGAAQRVVLKVGFDDGSKAEILDGLSDGDNVIVNPPATLSDGLAVSIKPPAATP